MSRGNPPRQPTTAHAGRSASAEKRSNALVRIRFPPDLLPEREVIHDVYSELDQGSNKRRARDLSSTAAAKVLGEPVKALEMLQADPAKRGAQRTAAAVAPAVPQGATLP